MRYRMEYLVIVDHEDGMERDARPGWLLIDNIASDDDARGYAEWNDEGILDVDFLDPGNHWASASNGNIVDGKGPDLVGNETFFSAVITKIERVTPIQIGSDARCAIGGRPMRRERCLFCGFWLQHPTQGVHTAAEHCPTCEAPLHPHLYQQQYPELFSKTYAEAYERLGTMRRCFCGHENAEHVTHTDAGPRELECSLCTCAEFNPTRQAHCEYPSTGVDSCGDCQGCWADTAWLDAAREAGALVGLGPATGTVQY